MFRFYTFNEQFNFYFIFCFLFYILYFLASIFCNTFFGINIWQIEKSKSIIGQKEANAQVITVLYPFKWLVLVHNCGGCR